MTKDIFKQIIPSLTVNDEYQIESSEDEKSVSPYLINKYLSSYIDTVFHANEMNKNSFLDKKLQYDYLFFSIRKYKRKYQKWIKYNESKNIQIIKEYYNCSTKKAEEYASILTKEQIKELSEGLNTGGRIK